MSSIFYSISALPSFPGSIKSTLSYRPAVSGNGIVVGNQADSATGNLIASMIDGQQVTPIPPPNAIQSWATDINDFGQIVGGYIDASGQTFGFFRDQKGNFVKLEGVNGDMKNIIRLEPRMNRNGVVVGTSGTEDGGQHAVQWTPLANGGVPQDLNTANLLVSDAYDINDSGTVAGIISLNGTGNLISPTAALFSMGQWTWTVQHTVSGNIRLANGSAMTGHFPSGEVFLYRNGWTQLLNQTGSGMAEPFGISPGGGTVVGNRWDGDHTIPFFFNDQTGTIDLQDVIPPNSDWELGFVYSMSRDGEYILGEGNHGNNIRFPFLMKREVIIDSVPPPPVAPIPHDWAGRILFGGVLDNAGTQLGPTGPRPVPGNGDGSLPRLTPGMDGVLSVLAQHELTRFSVKAKVRRELQPALLQSAIAQLELMAKRAAVGGEPSTRRKSR